jgi:hypothetical protein
LELFPDGFFILAYELKWKDRSKIKKDDMSDAQISMNVASNLINEKFSCKEKQRKQS